MVKTDGRPTIAWAEPRKHDNEAALLVRLTASRKRLEQAHQEYEQAAIEYAQRQRYRQ